MCVCHEFEQGGAYRDSQRDVTANPQRLPRSILRRNRFTGLEIPVPVCDPSHGLAQRDRLLPARRHLTDLSKKCRFL